MKEYKSRWYVEVHETMYGATATRKIYLPLADVDYIKCLKKLWKRVCRQFKNMDNVDVHAVVESEDGEFNTVSTWWEYEEMDKMEELGLI